MPFSLNLSSIIILMLIRESIREVHQVTWKIHLPSSRGVYELDVMSRGPDRGFYRLVVSVDAPDTRLVGHTAAQLTFKVLTAIDIQGVEIGTADSDQSTAPNLKKFVFLCFLSNYDFPLYCLNYYCPEGSY